MGTAVTPCPSLTPPATSCVEPGGMHRNTQTFNVEFEFVAMLQTAILQANYGAPIPRNYSMSDFVPVFHESFEACSTMGCNTLRTSVSPRQKKSAADGKVLRVSPSLQPSPQTVEDPSSVTTAADNLPQELASSATRGFTGSSERPELIRRPDGRLHHHSMKAGDFDF